MVLREENWKCAINVIRSFSYCKFFVFYFLLNKLWNFNGIKWATSPAPGIVYANKQRLAH